MEMALLPRPSPLGPGSPAAPKSPLHLRRAGLGCGASEGDVLCLPCRLFSSSLFSWSQYSSNAGERINLLTTIREPQLCATEGFVRTWVISFTVESNITNTCCCFFCFARMHTKVLYSNTSI